MHFYLYESSFEKESKEIKFESPQMAGVIPIGDV